MVGLDVFERFAIMLDMSTQFHKNRRTRSRDTALQRNIKIDESKLRAHFGFLMEIVEILYSLLS